MSPAGTSVFDGSGRTHFVGVGGAGMSAIAKVLLERGHEVSGSDLKGSGALVMLEATGAIIHTGHDASFVEGAARVVVSSAIPPSNPEIGRAREEGIPVLTRGEALAALLAPTRSIVVAGTHGKTTTTSMIVSILNSVGLDPTYLVGAGLNDAGTNARSGRGDIAAAESDESDGSFLLLTPHLAVVTNVELDHVDHWGSMADLLDGFERFMSNSVPEGTLVVPSGDADLLMRARRTGRKVRTFGLGAGSEVAATDVALKAGHCSFVLRSEGGAAGVQLPVPGRHNVLNALAAAGACLEVGVSLGDVALGLGRYRGVERRFQVRGDAKGVTVVDDYAHHPTEVMATLEAARPAGWRRVIAVFQPHRYSRTAMLAGEFGAAFADADRVVVTDVYGAGEQPVPGVSGKLVADAVCAALPGRPVAYFPHRAELIAYLESCARPGDAFFTLGAGDVTTIGEELLERLDAR